MTKDDRTGEADIERVENIATPQRDHIVYDDPHVAAREDNPAEPEKLSWATTIAIVVSMSTAFHIITKVYIADLAQFLGLSAVGPISCGFQMVTSILVDIGTALDGVSAIGWIVSGWSIASSVSFTIAGSMSDIFGRRYVILLGELISIIGGVSAFILYLRGTWH
jgi:MFS family permease